MKDAGIGSGEIMLFRTTDGDWRVMDFSGDWDGYPETVYWNSSLKDAMKTFGFMTARKSWPRLKETAPKGELTHKD